MTMELSAHVARDWMHQSMEGCAVNDEQTRLLWNPDPAVNSIVELAQQALHSGVAVEVIADLITLTRKTLESNLRERGIHFELAGQFDDLAAQLMDQERNGSVRRQLTVKALGRALRPALTALRAGGSAIELAPHYRVVEQVFATVPSAQLFTASMRAELRDPNYTLLGELHRARLGAEGMAA